MNTAILEAINEVREGKGDEAITSLNHTTHLRDDLGLDSFDLAELTVRIEEKTGVDIFENGIVETIGEIAKQIDG
jgi:acyl carrier protein